MTTENRTIVAQFDGLTIAGRAELALLGLAEDRQNAEPFRSHAYFHHETTITTHLMEQWRISRLRHELLRAAGDAIYAEAKFVLLPNLPLALPSGIDERAFNGCNWREITHARWIASAELVDAFPVGDPCTVEQQTCDWTTAFDELNEEAAITEILESDAARALGPRIFLDRSYDLWIKNGKALGGKPMSSAYADKVARAAWRRLYSRVMETAAIR